MGFLHGSPLLYAVASVLVLLVLRSVFRTTVIRRNGTPLRKPRDTLPLAGNGIRFLQARQKLFSWFVRCQDHFGYETYQISVPTLPPGVVISDPRNLDFVMKNEGSLVSKGNFVKDLLWDLFGYGIVNADGELWRVQRRAGQAFLNTANIRVLTDVALPRYLANTLESLRAGNSESREGQDEKQDKKVDLQNVFHELTSRIMGKMAYNMEMHADDDFSLAFDHASAATTKRFQNPMWRFTDLFQHNARSETRKAIILVKAFGERIVATAVADRRAKEGGGKAAPPASPATPAPPLSSASAQSVPAIDNVSGSLIQSLLDSIPDEDIVADAALNYLSAGRDTVAQALTWTFYMLMKHPHVIDRIRQEVERRLLADSSAAPLLSSLAPSALPYTMAVFYEGLRLFPPIPFEIKQVEADAGITLPDGTFLPKDALILWCSWALNRSRRTWGDDADEFRPERWLSDSLHASDTPDTSLPHLFIRSAAEFPVFHGGPRLCLGKKMAEAMAVQIMAAIVWQFDLSPADSRDRIAKTSLTLPMEDGLPCLVRERSVDILPTVA